MLRWRTAATRRPWPQTARAQVVGALLFDFDGTLWDPEPDIFRSYQELFEEYDQRLLREQWVALIGTIGFDPWAWLEERSAKPLDRAPAEARLRRRQAELLSRIGPRPGVVGYLWEADALGMRRGIVTNSPRNWVERYAPQSGVGDGWCVVESADGDVARAKPRPDLYVAALEKLDVGPDEVVAFEDSPTGIRAAKGAGIRCVAVPNVMTHALDLSEADLILGSFEDMALRSVLLALDRRRRPALHLGLRGAGRRTARPARRRLAKS